MKLYHFTHSPNSRRVRMLLAEKGVEVELHDVDLMAGEQFTPEFKAINPRSMVPVLETDAGERLTETVALLDYLDQIGPGPALFGAEPLARASIMAWEQRMQADAIGSMEDLIRNSMPGLAGRAKPGPQSVAQIPALADRGRERMLELYTELDAELADRPYLAGDAFSVADITLLCAADFCQAAGGLEIPATCASLQAWHERVSARPSASA